MDIPVSPIPFFWRISQQVRVLLISYQWEVHGLKLKIPPEPPYPYLPSIESLKEIDKLLRRPPKRQVRVK